MRTGLHCEGLMVGRVHGQESDDQICDFRSTAKILREFKFETQGSNDSFRLD